jgi:tetratricopeptide (TPR) repeat protein
MLCGQGSFERRAPRKAALPYLREARNGLTEFVRKNPDHAEAWRALSAAEEALLHYPAAVKALERAIALGPERERRDLKKMVLLRECAEKWDSLGVSPALLKKLGRHLEAVLITEPCDHSLRRTEAWLVEQGVRDFEQVLSGFERHGGHCDCEVLFNVVQ